MFDTVVHHHHHHYYFTHHHHYVHGEHMQKELDALAQEVKETNDVIASAIKLINGLASQIRAMKADPAKLVDLAGSLDAQSKALAEAIAANTSSETAPPEPSPAPAPTEPAGPPPVMSPTPPPAFEPPGEPEPTT